MNDIIMIRSTASKKDDSFIERWHDVLLERTPAISFKRISTVHDPTEGLAGMNYRDNMPGDDDADISPGSYVAYSGRGNGHLG